MKGEVHTRHGVLCLYASVIVSNNAFGVLYTAQIFRMYFRYEKHNENGIDKRLFQSLRRSAECRFVPWAAMTLDVEENKKRIIKAVKITNIMHGMRCISRSIAQSYVHQCPFIGQSPLAHTISSAFV